MLDQWQAMTREEVEIKALVDVSLGSGKPQHWISSRESQWQSLHKQQKLRTAKKRDPDAMDIDAVQTGGRTKEEKAKLIKEKRCFYCEKPGHIASQCWAKKEEKGKKRSGDTSKVRTAKAKDTTQREEEKESSNSEEQEEAPPDYNEEGITAAVRKMTAEKREAFMEQMALKGF